MICPVCGHKGNLPGADACEKCQFPLSTLDVPAPYDQVERSLMTDPVSALDPKTPVTVPLGTTLGDAISRMIALRVGAVLVTDANGQLAGILTERDFLAKVAGSSGFESLPVDQFMTRKPETVLTTDPLAFALAKMAGGGYRHLPVVENQRPIGVISVRDFLRHIVQLCRD